MATQALDLWSLVRGKPQIDPNDLSEAVSQQAGEDDLDYRTRQKVRLRHVAVPRALRDPMMDLCDRLGLDFAAADFMRAPRGKELRFLEVNSQPMFAAFDQACGGKLCDAIIDHLAPR